MQTTETYLGLLHERGKRGLPLKRVYRQLFNRNLYLAAYGKIYRNAGALTPGVTDDTADTMSLDKIERIIAAVRTERYQWQPARRTYIPKKNGKQRPLGGFRELIDLEKKRCEDWAYGNALHRTRIPADAHHAQ